MPYCPSCGKEVREGASFCAECGNPVKGNSVPQDAKQPERPKVEAAGSQRLATAGKRFANYLIDFAGCYAFGYSIGFVLGATDNGALIDGMNETFLGILILITYYTFFESIWHRTPAKWLTRTKVVMHDGSVPSFGNILGRSCARLIPFEALSFLGGARPRGWHDRISGTSVIED